jgi:hypothetical protein
MQQQLKGLNSSYCYMLQATAANLKAFNKHGAARNRKEQEGEDRSRKEKKGAGRGREEGAHDRLGRVDELPFVVLHLQDERVVG